MQSDPLDAALARGVLARWLGLGFRYPRSESLGELREAVAGAEEAARILAEAGGSDLVPAVRAVTGALAAPSDEGLESEYIRLFGHSAQGDCPPYEAEYAESEEQLQQPHELGDLSGFYEAFGLKVGGESRERFDHLAIQCEFLCFLATKESFAREADDPALLEAAERAQQVFMKNHLGRWLPAFARRVVDHAPAAGVLSPLASLALALVTGECARFGIRPGSERLRLRKLRETPEECLTCPAASGAEAPLETAGPMDV